ncbi:MAG: glycoside hydrolase family 5 protein [Prevotella sp.]|nr:glycoside hydrolase family 5 protein [Prevotella sp.]
MKRLLTICILITSACILHAQSGLDKSATEIAKEMMPGWNLGNTMEAAINWGSNPAAVFNNNGGLASETAWQGTKTTQQIIDFVKAQGFRSVRIPCAWVYGHISNATNYTIDATWMARVKQIVDYCINDGLYVILNDHWDGGWLEEHINATGTTKTKNKEVLKSIWTQIATEFKDYDEHLVFAGLNEPNVEQQSVVTSLVEYEQVFIDAVRATGGNNAKRLLVVQGPSTDTEKTCNWMTNKMPNDPIGNKLAIEIHFYYPWNFWGMTKDESWGNMFYYWGSGNHVSGSTHNATYGEESDMKALADRLKTCFVDKGIPVINGEYGVIWRTNISGVNESQEKHNASIKAYYKTMNKLCMERGIVPLAWDTNSTGNNQMTIINRSNLAIYNPYMMEGIKEAMEELGITAIAKIKANPYQNNPRIYNLHGQQVQKPQHGIFIQNGKKYVVR